MRQLFILLIASFLITSCKGPEDKIASNAATIIKGLIDNPTSYEYKDMEFMEESTYGANLKFWENYFRQNFFKNSKNQNFEDDMAAIKEKFSSKLDQVSVQKYKINYFETDAAGKVNPKSRVLYFNENQEQVKGMVYIYGIDAFELDGILDFSKYGVIE